MKVQFLADTEVRDHRGLVEQSFGAGEVVELSTASARRWIRRNKAVEFLGEAAAVVKPVVPPAETGDHGGSPDSGQEKPPSSSPPDPASTIETSSTSDAPEKPDVAESLSSTAPTSAPPGQTSSTAATPRGGGKRVTRRGSRG